MPTEPTHACNCGAENWQHVLTDGKNGHKGGRDRDPTKRHVYACESCGKEGRIFVDGVDGTVTHSGALRGGTAHV